MASKSHSLKLKLNERFEITETTYRESIGKINILKINRGKT